MCFPKAPKEDPAAKAAREAQLQAEKVRLTEAKETRFRQDKSASAGLGIRSLLGASGRAGFGTTGRSLLGRRKA